MMAVGKCDGCGLEKHLCMEIETDGPVNTFLGRRQYCQSCGSYLAGVIDLVQRRVFRCDVVTGNMKP